ncbi:MAG: FAD-dependent oxidoreductase [Clostridia bacterium]|nr:FAD-dependent oxidoreductase [Clostridia bacterium]
MYDTIVIGKGPSGISCALYLKRAGFNVLVIGKDGGSLAMADYIENYYGFAKPVKADKLFSGGIKQAENLGIEIISDEVTDIEYGGGISVKTLSAAYEAKTLLFATGRKKKSAPIRGLKEFEGKGVGYCAVCDGFFYKNKDVAVIGGGKYALAEAEYLKNIVRSVKIFSDGKAEKILSESFDGDIINEKILSIYGGQTVEGIKTEGGDYALSGVFVALGSAGAADFAAKMGLETLGGNIAVNKDYSTNIPAVFAAGDCIGGMAQIAKAVYDGAAAAKTIISYLKSSK